MTTEQAKGVTRSINNVITLSPNQLVVIDLDIMGNLKAVYAGLFDISGNNKQAYDTFIELSQQMGLFSYSNAGTDAFGETNTFDDGMCSAAWFTGLCIACSSMKKIGIDVVIKLDKKLMTDSEVTKASRNYAYADQVSEAQSEKIIDSYIWYFKQFIARKGLMLQCRAEGKPVYNIRHDTVADAFLINI